MIKTLKKYLTNRNITFAIVFLALLYFFSGFAVAHEKPEDGTIDLNAICSDWEDFKKSAYEDFGMKPIVMGVNNAGVSHVIFMDEGSTNYVAGVVAPGATGDMLYCASFWGTGVIWFNPEYSENKGPMS